MVPTLETGDFILVNKFDYGVRLPIVNKKVIDVGEPERGDVIVFRYPPQPTISYIKRVVGIPGDHIVFDHGQLTINGQKIAKVPVEFSREKDSLDTPTSIYHKETIGKHTFTMRELEGVNVARQAPYINFVENGKYSAENGLYWEVKVKEGEYFAMGDNRDQSADSRFWGMVPEQNLTGRAFYIWMHKEPGFKLPHLTVTVALTNIDSENKKCARINKEHLISPFYLQSWGLHLWRKWQLQFGLPILMIG